MDSMKKMIDWIDFLSMIAKDIEDEKSPVKKVVYDPPKTTVYWKDGGSTTVKCAPGTVYDKYAGFCAAVTKHFFGGSSCAVTRAAGLKKEDEPFKVGDKVVVVDDLSVIPSANGGDKKIHYPEAMKKKQGKIVTISKVIDTPKDSGREFFPRYHIEGDDWQFYWGPDAFKGLATPEQIEKDELLKSKPVKKNLYEVGDKVLIVKDLSKTSLEEEGAPGLAESMKVMEGDIGKVAKVTFYNGAAYYKLEGIVYTWTHDCFEGVVRPAKKVILGV